MDADQWNDEISDQCDGDGGEQAEVGAEPRDVNNDDTVELGNWWGQEEEEDDTVDTPVVGTSEGGWCTLGDDMSGVSLAVHDSSSTGGRRDREGRGRRVTRWTGITLAVTTRWPFVAQFNACLEYVYSARLQPLLGEWEHQRSQMAGNSHVPSYEGGLGSLSGGPSFVLKCADILVNLCMDFPIPIPVLLSVTINLEQMKSKSFTPATVEISAVQQDFLGGHTKGKRAKTIMQR